MRLIHFLAVVAALVAFDRPTPAQADSFGAGVFLVGVDVAPGVYRAQPALGSMHCSWRRLSGVGGSFDEIIAIEIVDDGPALVEIASSDYAFRSSGCTEWRRVGRSSSTVTYKGPVAGRPAAQAAGRDSGQGQREVCVARKGLVRMPAAEADTAIRDGTATEPYVYPCRNAVVCERTAWKDELEDRCRRREQIDYPVVDVTQVRLEIVRDSREAYEAAFRADTRNAPGDAACPCPYSLGLGGRRCEDRSAYVAISNDAPLCYPSDVTQAILDEHRDANPRLWEEIRPEWPAGR
jgi:hypothetical protein